MSTKTRSMYTWYMQVVCEQSITTLPRLHDQTRKLLMKTTATDAKVPVRHLRRSIMQTPSLKIQLGRQLRMFEKRMMLNLISQALLACHCHWIQMWNVSHARNKQENVYKHARDKKTSKDMLLWIRAEDCRKHIHIRRSAFKYTQGPHS